jgi:hypothetical protein
MASTGPAAYFCFVVSALDINPVVVSGLGSYRARNSFVFIDGALDIYPL